MWYSVNDLNGFLLKLKRVVERTKSSLARTLLHSEHATSIIPHDLGYGRKEEEEFVPPDRKTDISQRISAVGRLFPMTQ